MLDISRESAVVGKFSAERIQSECEYQSACILALWTKAATCFRRTALLRIPLTKLWWVKAVMIICWILTLAILERLVRLFRPIAPRD